MTFGSRCKSHDVIKADRAHRLLGPNVEDESTNTYLGYRAETYPMKFVWRKLQRR